MTDQNQVALAADQPAALATVMGVSPKELMSYAIDTSEILSKTLRERGMTKKFGANEHVQTEGWQLAGSCFGFVVEEGDEHEIKELPDGSFKAKVYLVRLSNGKRVASASGYCGVDEPNWRSKPKYARRGMAITRAIGRVYAQNFRWLIKLAGYEGTPAEEMSEVRTEDKQEHTYSTHNLDDKRWLAKMFPEDVAKTDLASISVLMHGKPISALDDVATEYFKKKGE